MHLRITQTQDDHLRKFLLNRTDVETAGILLARLVGDTVLAVEQIIPWPEDGYQDRTGDHIHLDPGIMVKLTRPARDHGWSIFTIHTHPGCVEAWFSHADDAGDVRLMESFRQHIPGVPHGSLVLTGSGQLAARWFDDTGNSHPLKVTSVGSAIVALHGNAGVVPLPRDHRQVLALGADGMARLRRCHIGVVGLGGMGSEVSKSLAHLGVGQLTLIDGDIIEESNLPRIVGAMPTDVADKRPKVEVAKRYTTQIGSPSMVVAQAKHLTPSVVRQLVHCDLVLACVDRQTPRAILNRMAYDAAVPVIDCGVGFRVDPISGVLLGDAGRVVVIGPGRPCLACWGHLDPDVLREEALPPEEVETLAAEGYIHGAEVHQPAVMAFNAMVANAAVIEVLRLVAGFAPDLVNRIGFSFSRAAVSRNAIAGDRRCQICQGEFSD